MITTIYTCDKCGHAQDTKEQMWQVQVSIGSIGERPSQNRAHAADWCRKCAEAAHLLPDVRHKEAKEELPPPPTLEDLVRQIVREEMEVPFA